MTLTVTDSQGRKYKPTGCFREPKPNEFVYCVKHQRVEFNPHWCIDDCLPFSTLRIIVEPLPVEYEVMVRLTAEQLNCARTHMDLKPADHRHQHFTGEVLAWVFDAIGAGNYREVQP